MKFYDLSSILKIKNNIIKGEPLSLKRVYSYSFIYRKFFYNKILKPNLTNCDCMSIANNPSGLEIVLSKVLGIDITFDHRFTFRGRINNIFSLYFTKKDKIRIKHDVKFISVGKKNNLMNCSFCYNNDLFFIDKNGYVYIIDRENNNNDLLQKTLFDMFGLPNIIEEDNYSLKVTFEYPEGNYLNEVIYFLRYVTRLELREDKIVCAYFDNLTKSKGLKKYISKSEYFSESFQDYLIRHYERIFLLYIFKGEFNINDLISKINEIELSIKRVDSLSKEELINCLGKYCFNSFVLFYKEDDIHNLNNLLSSNFVLSNNMLILAKNLINKTNKLSKLIYDKIEIDEKDLENLYEKEMDFVRNKRR